MSNKTSLFPTWKQAVADAQAFDYGQTITFDWLRKAFDLPEFAEGTKEEFQRSQFTFLEHMDGFRDALLHTQKKALRNIRGVGYLVIQPNEHADFAKDKFRYYIAKGIEAASEILENTAFDRLTQEELQASRDAQAKIAAFNAIAQRQIEKQDKDDDDDD